MRNIVLAAVLAAGLAGCQQQGGSPSQEARNEPLTAAQIVSGFQAKGLPVVNPESFTSVTDPNKLLGRPHQYVSKTDFKDNRQDPERIQNDNAVEVFTNRADAEARRDYVDMIMQRLPMFTQYQYLRGNALVRIDGSLTPEQAAEYEKALAELVPESSR